MRGGRPAGPPPHTEADSQVNITIITMNEELREILQAWLAAKVDEERFRHSLRVMELVPELAAAHGAAAGPLELAALVHDAARGMTGAGMLAAAEEWALPVREIDRSYPILLHGMLASEMARRELGISEGPVLSAVLYHTAGHPQMTLSDKLLFLADMIEPARKLPRSAELRRLAFTDVDRAMLLAIDINKEHLKVRGRPVDPVTLELELALSN